MKSYELAEWNDEEPIICHSSMLSVCCGAPPFGELEMGICSQCHEHTTFEQDTDDE